VLGHIYSVKFRRRKFTFSKKNCVKWNLMKEVCIVQRVILAYRSTEVETWNNSKMARCCNFQEFELRSQVLHSFLASLLTKLLDGKLMRVRGCAAGCCQWHPHTTLFYNFTVSFRPYRVSEMQTIASDDPAARWVCQAVTRLRPTKWLPVWGVDSWEPKAHCVLDRVPT